MYVMEWTYSSNACKVTVCTKSEVENSDRCQVESHQRHKSMYWTCSVGNGPCWTGWHWSRAVSSGRPSVGCIEPLTKEIGDFCVCVCVDTLASIYSTHMSYGVSIFACVNSLSPCTSLYVYL